MATAEESHLPQEKKADRSSFFVNDVGNVLDPETRAALQDYIGLSADELDPHLLEAREKAWKVSPYPCVGLWSFLRPGLPRHRKFEIIKQNAKSVTPGSYLICDVGTGVGQELRALTIAGVSSKSLRAIDISAGLWNVGFDLFRDKDRMDGAAFAVGNVLKPDEQAFAAWKGTMDVAVAGSLLHLFDWDGQVIALKSLFALLKDKSGSMVVGWQLGGKGEHVKGSTSGKIRFRHTDESFMAMSRVVDQDIELKWDIGVKTITLPKAFLEKQASWLPQSTTLLYFSFMRK